MPLVYEPGCQPADPLRQGEILSNVWEHQAIHAASWHDSNVPLEVESVSHPLVVVLTADCDLEQDHRLRAEAASGSSRVLGHVLLCDAYEGDAAIPVASDLRRRIRQNQDERYHYFPAAEIGRSGALPIVILDFLHTFVVPTARLYEAVAQGNVERRAVVPPVYVHDLIHRFFGFHSRIGLPD